MKLTVTTPLAIVVDTDDVVHLRAEDETGAAAHEEITVAPGQRVRLALSLRPRPATSSFHASSEPPTNNERHRHDQ